MNVKKLTLLLFSSMIVLLTACPSHDDKKSDKEIAVENLSRAWKVNSVTGNIGTEDSYANLVLTLNANGTYTMSGYENIAADNRPAKSASGNWVVNQTATQISFSGNDGDNTVDVSTHTAANFIFHFEGKEAPKLTTAITVEYNMIPQ